jgi:uncharacterized protein (TIGR00251 family)
MEALSWQRQSDGITIRIWAQPGASKTAVVGIQGDALKVALQARPVEGAANEALIKALAGWFEVRRSQVRIKHGEQQRQKLIAIQGDPEQLARRLSALVAQGG